MDSLLKIEDQDVFFGVPRPRRRRGRGGTRPLLRCGVFGSRSMGVRRRRSSRIRRRRGRGNARSLRHWSRGRGRSPWSPSTSAVRGGWTTERHRFGTTAPGVPAAVVDGEGWCAATTARRGGVGCGRAASRWSGRGTVRDHRHDRPFQRDTMAGKFEVYCRPRRRRAGPDRRGCPAGADARRGRRARRAAPPRGCTARPHRGHADHRLRGLGAAADPPPRRAGIALLFSTCRRLEECYEPQSLASSSGVGEVAHD
jgi:hypothetical protein